MARSRDWICVRLATYESKAEGAFLASLFTGRSGVLENTTFALLAPDGRKRLSRTGRGPNFLLGAARGRSRPRSDGTAEAFAQLLVGVAKGYRPKAKPAALPQSLDFRRALNVAACDNQPLVLVCAKSQDVRASLAKHLASLAWSQKYVGRLQYAVVSTPKEGAAVKGLGTSEGVFFIQPGRFGLTGEVLAKTSTTATKDVIAKVLDKGLSRFRAPKKDTRSQVRAGHRAGVAWESEIPVTDPGPASGERRRKRR